MPTKKQLRAAQKRRHDQYEAKVTARQAKRRRRQQIAGVVAVAVLVLGAGGIAVTAGLGSTPSPSASPSLSPSATPAPEPTFIPKPGASTPPLDYAQNREWAADITLDQGTIRLSLDGVAAPTAVASFVYLAQQGFFNGTPCHRLVTDQIYVLQCGDPTGTGNGGPDYRFGPVENAPTDQFYPAGTLAMARVPQNGFSQGSQFFIVYKDSYIGSDSAGGYTVFGKVTSGLDIVVAIAAAGIADGSTDGAPAQPVVLREVSVQ